MTGPKIAEIKDQKEPWESPPTPRELEIAKMFADDLTAEQICVQLAVNRQTVKNHLKNLGKKLGVHRTPAIVAQCFRKGLIE